jgi:hypothetical protein
MKPMQSLVFLGAAKVMPMAPARRARRATCELLLELERAGAMFVTSGNQRVRVQDLSDREIAAIAAMIRRNQGCALRRTNP